MGRLEGKVAIVTGGASGIGEAAVRLFVAEGARVVLADVQDDLGHRVEESVGGNCRYVRTDVSRAADVEATVEAAISTFGKLDTVFNNAAVIQTGPSITDASEDDFDRTIAVDLKGVWLGMKYAARAMMASGGGAIVNTGSTSALVGFMGQPAYGAAKGGVVSLTRHAAVDLARHRIRVNCICPGGILTPLVFQRRPGIPEADVEREFASRNPLQRAGRPIDIARAALWLVSDDSAHVTGQVIAIDGGTTASIYRGATPDAVV